MPSASWSCHVCSWRWEKEQPFCRNCQHDFCYFCSLVPEKHICLPRGLPLAFGTGGNSLMRVGSNPMTNLLHCNEGLPWQVCPHLGWSQPVPSASHQNLHAMLPREVYSQLNLPQLFEQGRSASTIPDVYPRLNTPSIRPLKSVVHRHSHQQQALLR